MSNRRDEDRQAPQDPLAGTVLQKLLGRGGAGKGRSAAGGPASTGAGRARPEASGRSSEGQGPGIEVGSSRALSPGGGGALARLLGRARGYDRERAAVEAERRQRLLDRLGEAHMHNLVKVLQRLFGG